MSIRECFESCDEEDDQDTQQVQQVAEVYEQRVQAILDIIADRLRYESLSLYEYVEQTLRDGSRQTWMPTCTSQNLGDELAVWIKDACDNNDGQRAAYMEGRR